MKEEVKMLSEEDIKRLKEGSKNVRRFFLPKEIERVNKDKEKEKEKRV